MYSSRANLLIGFHGCDTSVVNHLVNNPKKVKTSEKPFDWLGHGFYILENNCERALQWAKDKQKRGDIEKAAVVGVVCTLDYNGSPLRGKKLFYKIVKSLNFI